MTIQSFKERLKVYAKLLFNTALLIFVIKLIGQLERVEFINILDRSYLLKPLTKSGLLDLLDKFSYDEYSLLMFLIGLFFVIKIHISNYKKSHEKWVEQCAINYIENTTNVHLMSKDEIVIDINKGKISNELFNLEKIKNEKVKSEIAFAIIFTCK